MAAGAGTERCSCTRGGEQAGGIPALRKQQKPPCKPNKHWPVPAVLTPTVFVLAGCRAQGNGMESELPPSPSSACGEGLLQVCSVQRAWLCLSVLQARAIKGACTHVCTCFSVGQQTQVLCCAGFCQGEEERTETRDGCHHVTLCSAGRHTRSVAAPIRQWKVPK